MKVSLGAPGGNLLDGRFGMDIPDGPQVVSEAQERQQQVSCRVSYMRRAMVERCVSCQTKSLPDQPKILGQPFKLLGGSQSGQLKDPLKTFHPWQQTEIVSDMERHRRPFQPTQTALATRTAE